MAADQQAGADILWDVIVIGTGMGGATVGHSLASRGHQVLFLEKGRADVEADGAADLDDDPDKRLRAGRWPDRITAEIDGARSQINVPLGCGPGGSTLLYAAALERFERSDFEAAEGRPHPTGGWPVSYDEMRPYYEQAERLYRVKGTQDPLGEPGLPEMPRPPFASELDGLFMRDFAAAGLHPYRLHVGIAYKPGCLECLGRICPLRCKSDARTICLEPAVDDFGATLLTGCEVERIDADREHVRTVFYRQQGEAKEARGRVVILSAGTYRSAVLLLQSANAHWPSGLANGSGLVGRNLMFHSSDWIAIWPRRRGSPHGPKKAVALRDFYIVDGVRLGSLQSTGLSASYGNVLFYLHNWFDRSRWRWLRPMRPLLRIPAFAAAKLFGSATIFAMIMEDMADEDNRLVPDPDDPARIVVRYRITSDLLDRTRFARSVLRKRLAGFRKLWVQPSVMVDFGHPSGTCRFGLDPAASVLDRDCRAHELDNLYVVDGSFMPSSGGANPSLTIAANAIRVGEAIDARLRAGASAGISAEAACSGSGA